MAGLPAVQEGTPSVRTTVIRVTLSVLRSQVPYYVMIAAMLLAGLLLWVDIAEIIANL